MSHSLLSSLLFITLVISSTHAQLPSFGGGGSSSTSILQQMIDAGKALTSSPEFQQASNYIIGGISEEVKKNPLPKPKLDSNFSMKPPVMGEGPPSLPFATTDAPTDAPTTAPEPPSFQASQPEGDPQPEVEEGDVSKPTPSFADRNNAINVDAAKDPTTAPVKATTPVKPTPTPTKVPTKVPTKAPTKTPTKAPNPTTVTPTTLIELNPIEGKTEPTSTSTSVPVTATTAPDPDPAAVKATRAPTVTPTTAPTSTPGLPALPQGGSFGSLLQGSPFDTTLTTLNDTTLQLTAGVGPNIDLPSRDTPGGSSSLPSLPVMTASLPTFPSIQTSPSLATSPSLPSLSTAPSTPTTSSRSASTTLTPSASTTPTLSTTPSSSTTTAPLLRRFNLPTARSTPSLSTPSLSNSPSTTPTLSTQPSFSLPQV